MSSSSIIPVVPTQMILQPLTSNSEHVVSKRFRSFLPEVNGEYKYNSNNTIRITLNSASEFLSGTESYLEFKLTCTSTDTTPFLSAAQHLQRYLDHCGHSLFSSMKIQLSNGTIIEDINSYNKLYSLVRNYSMSQNQVDFVEGPLSGDSTEKFAVPNDRNTIRREIIGNAAAVVYDDAGGIYNRLLTFGNNASAQALSDLKVGDTIIVTNAAGVRQVVDVSAITDRRNIQLSDSLGGDVGDVRPVEVLRGSNIPSARQRSATTASIKIKIKPFSNLLNHNQLLPLMYMKNLQLVLTLERPEFVMSLIPTPDATISFDYTISDIKYQACLVQPSDEVLEMYRMAYNSESPEELSINIPFISYQHSMKYLDSPQGVQSFTIPSSCRSAVSIISAFYTHYSEAVSTTTNFTHNVDSISQTVKNGCTSYVYRVGSEMYPSSERADVSGPFNGQMLSWAQLALQSHGNTLQDVSFKPNEFFSTNRVLVRRGNNHIAPGVADIGNDSIRAVFASPLSRYFGFGCGVDLLQNDIIAEFDFNNHGLVDSTGVASSPQNVYVRSWIIHDRILSVNRAGITIKY